MPQTTTHTHTHRYMRPQVWSRLQGMLWWYDDDGHGCAMMLWLCIVRLSLQMLSDKVLVDIKTLLSHPKERSVSTAKLTGLLGAGNSEGAESDAGSGAILAHKQSNAPGNSHMQGGNLHIR